MTCKSAWDIDRIHRFIQGVKGVCWWDRSSMRERSFGKSVDFTPSFLFCTTQNIGRKSHIVDRKEESPGVMFQKHANKMPIYQPPPPPMTHGHNSSLHVATLMGWLDSSSQVLKMFRNLQRPTQTRPLVLLIITKKMSVLKMGWSRRKIAANTPFNRVFST